MGTEVQKWLTSQYYHQITSHPMLYHNIAYSHSAVMYESVPWHRYPEHAFDHTLCPGRGGEVFD